MLAEFNLGEYVKKVIDEQGRSIKYVSEHTKIKYQTLSAKLINNTLSGVEILNIAKLLDIDLNELKEICYKESIETE